MSGFIGKEFWSADAPSWISAGAVVVAVVVAIWQAGPILENVELNALNSQLERKRIEAQDDIDRLEGERAKLTADLDVTRSELQRAHSSLNSLQEMSTNLAKTSNNLTATIAALGNENDQLKVIRSNLEANNAVLIRDKRELDENIRNLRAEYTSAVNRLEQIEESQYEYVLETVVTKIDGRLASLESIHSLEVGGSISSGIGGFWEEALKTTGTITSVESWKNFGSFVFYPSHTTLADIKGFKTRTTNELVAAFFKEREWDLLDHGAKSKLRGELLGVFSDDADLLEARLFVDGDYVEEYTDAARYMSSLLRSEARREPVAVEGAENERVPTKADIERARTELMRKADSWNQARKVVEEHARRARELLAGLVSSENSGK